MMALAIGGFTFLSAEAQAQNKEVCRISKHKGSSCYSTKYAENFKVCKSNRGYLICGETPTRYNSTIKGNEQMAYQSMAYEQDTRQDMQDAPATNGTPDVMIAPQSQSYPAYNINSATSYEGYFPTKHYIKVSYDNVAEDNRAPYEGLPSPQYDGPQKNAERNINANNPNANLGPITGRPE